MFRLKDDWWNTLSDFLYCSSILGEMQLHFKGDNFKLHTYIFIFIFLSFRFSSYGVVDLNNSKIFRLFAICKLTLQWAHESKDLWFY